MSDPNFRIMAAFAMHSPLSESLQAYARRLGLSVLDAYLPWHACAYPAVVGLFTWPAQGPGLGLQPRDLPREIT